MSSEVKNLQNFKNPTSSDASDGEDLNLTNIKKSNENENLSSQTSSSILKEMNQQKNNLQNNHQSIWFDSSVDSSEKNEDYSLEDLVDPSALDDCEILSKEAIDEDKLGKEKLVPSNTIFKEESKFAVNYVNLQESSIHTSNIEGTDKRSLDTNNPTGKEGFHNSEMILKDFKDTNRNEILIIPNECRYVNSCSLNYIVSGLMHQHSNFRHPQVYGTPYVPFHQTKSNNSEQINAWISDSNFQLRFYDPLQYSEQTSKQLITTGVLDSNQAMNERSSHNVNINTPFGNLEECGISNSNEMHTNQGIQNYQFDFDDDYSSINSVDAIEGSGVYTQGYDPNHYTEDESSIYFINRISPEIQIDLGNNLYAQHPLNLLINSIPLDVQEEIHLRSLEAPDNGSEESNNFTSDGYDLFEENSE